MSKDLKDLIDLAEEQESSRAHLEKTIELLQIEVNKLRSKLEEKQSLVIPSIPPYKSEITDSTELDILKEMVNSQKSEIAQKEVEKEQLQKKIEGLNSELQDAMKTLEEVNKSEMLEKTQNSLSNLMENYANLEKINKTLKERFSELEENNERLSQEIDRLKSEPIPAETTELDTSNIRNRIIDLEMQNKILNEMITELNAEQLEDKDLEQKVEILQNTNFELENNIKSLNQLIEKLKAERFQDTKLEAKISSLNQKINELEKENLNLKRLETERPKDKIFPDTIPIEKKPPIQKFPPLKSPDLYQSPPIVEEEIKTKFVAISTPKTLSIEMNDFQTYKERFISPPESEDETLIEESSERKKICPKCGNKSKIREMLDKTNIILAYPKMYGKKYRCGQCGTEWH